MIICIHGGIGGGKTYRVVNDLEKYSNDHLILHNIEGLKPEKFQHPERFINIDSKYFSSGILPKDFFTKDFQEELTSQVRQKYNLKILLVIDEAHEYFYEQNKQYLIYLAYHRHFGQTIILITQNTGNIHHSYRKLFSHEYRSKLDLKLFFVYSRLDKGETTGFNLVPKKQKVFEKYTSFQIEGRKYRNLLLITFPFILIGGWYLFTRNPFGEGSLFNGSPSQSIIPPASSPGTSPGNFSPSPALSSPAPHESFWYYAGCVLFGSQWFNDLKKSRFLIFSENFPMADFRQYFEDAQYIKHTDNVFVFRDKKLVIHTIFRRPEKDDQSGPSPGSPGRAGWSSFTASN
jgi:hypothetical protein